DDLPGGQVGLAPVVDAPEVEVRLAGSAVAPQRDRQARHGANLRHLPRVVDTFGVADVRVAGLQHRAPAPPVGAAVDDVVRVLMPCLVYAHAHAFAESVPRMLQE